jgi:hypothetical protein
VVFRIYDILFIKGVDCLFQIGLALLKKNQSTLLALEFEALVGFLKDDILAIYNVRQNSWRQENGGKLI